MVDLAILGNDWQFTELRAPEKELTAVAMEGKKASLTSAET